MIWIIIFISIYDVVVFSTTEAEAIIIFFGNLFVIAFGYLLLDSLSKKSITTFQDGLVEASKNRFKYIFIIFIFLTGIVGGLLIPFLISSN